ncbi:hypothetical protein IWZ03DRAFT_246580 [Phyllosticta citriasiana]|uniref:Uncharacterized protein n=1 Tax=Phyllosticta citriasiana TaxID=595635 RepID=A0ABR1KGV1_9PEZI
MEDTQPPKCDMEDKLLDKLSPTSFTCGCMQVQHGQTGPAAHHHHHQYIFGVAQDAVPSILPSALIHSSGPPTLFSSAARSGGRRAGWIRPHPQARPGQARPGSRARKQASRPKAWRGMSPRKRTLPDGGQRHRESRQWNPSPHEAPRRFHCLCRAALLPLPRRLRLSVWSSLSISGACKARIKTLAQDVSVSFFIFLGQKAGHAACHWWADSTPAGGLKASGCAAD